MKRIPATLISCFVLLSATVSVPALAEAKGEAQQSNASSLQDALTTAADGIQSVIDGVKTNIAELFGTSEEIARDNNESAEQPASFSAQDTESAAVAPSNLDGVVWSPDYKTCTIQTGARVDGASLRSEIASHNDTLTTFEAQANTKLTGSAYSLFSASESLTTVKLANSFDTSQVSDMSYMFDGCSALSSLTLPDSFNTSSTQSMDYMFSGCSALSSLTLPETLNTSSVGDMQAMFANCSSLTSLTLPDTFATSAVTNMTAMFSGCTQLERLDLSMFSSENLTTCVGMFANCDTLKELNLGIFVPPAGEGSLVMFADVDTDTDEIFGSIPNIEKITMSSTCILKPGEGTNVDAASGTFFDYKEPLSWNAYYLGNAAEGQSSAQSLRNNLSAEPTAVLTGFDEFKAYQETHSGLTTYAFNGQPTPPGPTPDVAPAADTDTLPVTGDAAASLISAAVAVLMGTLALLVSGYSFARERLQ